MRLTNHGLQETVSIANEVLTGVYAAVVVPDNMSSSELILPWQLLHAYQLPEKCSNSNIRQYVKEAEES